MIKKTGVMIKRIWITCLPLLVLPGLLLTSCDKDPEELILGRWDFECYSYTITQYEEIIEEGNTSDEGIVYLAFFNSGTVDIGYEDGGPVSLDWQIQGDSLIMDPPDDDPIRLEIRNLDKKELKLAATRELDEDRLLKQTMVFKK
jgi:hypothetical protein